jgi:glycosyltransferase involved in cell wall biosynthesis
MRIAIFDYRVVATNPVGGCHLRLLEGMCREHQFTVFAPRFENPCCDRVVWVRVPAPMRPLALLFVAFHLVAPIVYLAHKLRRRGGFDLVQMVESNLSFGDIDYAHFCHRAYLERFWRSAQPRGLRGLLRWLDHRLHALAEPYVFRRARRIVVPSRGLARELSSYYPETLPRIHVIPNPVDLERMRRPSGFTAPTIRRELAVPDARVLLAFVALGHFERKGLPLLLEALHARRDALDSVRLWVVGGEPNLVEAYRGTASSMGLDSAVQFAGKVEDVRPFLWSADAFVAPSHYEALSLGLLEAAAAGLPLLVSRISGSEEVLQDGVNGFRVELTATGVASGLQRFARLSDDERRTMSEAARESVEPLRPERFASEWAALYRSLEPSPAAEDRAPLSREAA